MGKKKPEPWLAKFISAEINQVIQWTRSLDGTIKPDPDSRFEDDGSNFRSRALAADLPANCLLQLIEVILCSEQPVVVVSDGHTRIKARLSQDAVDVLEGEAGEKFTEEMTNDVFQPTSLTVIGTPLGTADGFIQLHIDSIEYEHHLRRTEGDPGPIEEHGGIRVLLDEINQIRCAGLPSADTPEDEHGAAEPAFESPRSVASQQLHYTSGVTPSGRPNLVPAHGSSSITRINNTQVTNSVIQTQQLLRRKRLGPNLDNDGFEVESGLNLDRPVQAASNDAPDTNAGTTALNKSARDTHLLDLLTANKGIKRPRESCPPLQRSPAVVSATQVDTVDGNAATRPPNAILGTDAHHSSTAAPPSAQPLPKQTQASSRSSGRAAIPYGRRKIPLSQFNLLDRKDSWLPSMPGQSFPSPNIPIELLTRWNALMRDAPEIIRLSQASQTVDEAMVDEEPQSSAEESSDGSDSDKEFGPSQWGSSPPQRAAEYPPDSSFESVVRASQQDELRVAPPRAMPTARTSDYAATARYPRPPGSASRETHDYRERPARGDDTGGSRRSRSSLDEISPPSRSQHTRQSQSRYDSYRPEGPSPQRNHYSDAEIAYDGSRPRPRSAQWNRLDNRTFSARSTPRGPASQVIPDRSINESQRRLNAGRSPSGVWTTQTGVDAPWRPALNGSAVATIPPSGPRAMSRENHQRSYAETPSRPTISQSQPSADRSVNESRRPALNGSTAMSPPSGPRGTPRDSYQPPYGETPLRHSVPQSQPSTDRLATSSQWPNVPMVGRRKSGAPLGSSLRGPAADAAYNEVRDQRTPSNLDTHRPAASSAAVSRDYSVIPGTQIPDSPSHDAQRVRGDRSDPSHQPPARQHPDQRYHEVRRNHMSHYKRQGWVKEFYHVDPAGSIPFEMVYHSYRVNHKTKSGKHERNDHDLTIDNFMLAVQDAFPDNDTTNPLDMRFRALKRVKRPSHMSQKGADDQLRDSSPSRADTTTHADQPGREKEILRRDRAARKDPEDRAENCKSPKEGTSRARELNPRATNKTIKEGKKSVEERTEKGQTSAQGAGKAEEAGRSSTQAAGGGTASTGVGGGQALGVPTQQQQQRRRGPPTVGELAGNWLNIRPGGAFAAPQQGPTTTRRRVDMLRFDRFERQPWMVALQGGEGVEGRHEDEADDDACPEAQKGMNIDNT